MSNSALPDGGYTLTHGSNYMLDGFQFDTEYNGGVLEKARLPEAKGLSALPSGMIPPDSTGASDIPDGLEADSQMDLDVFTKDSSEQLPTIIDHEWLASNPVENLEGERTHDEVMQMFSEGVAGHPEVKQLKALEEAWGSRTTGLDIVPNEARKVKPKPEKHTTTLPQDEVSKSAFRRLAYGEKISDIITDENVSARTASEMQSMYGLSGRVYIRASDFPGLFNGRWNEVIKKRCASAQYIISDEGCAYDRYLGMGVVANERQIPWKSVYASLMPKLESCGVTKTSTSDHRYALKQAFIDLTEGNVKSADVNETWFQILPDATQGLSYRQAADALARAQVDNPYIETQEQRELSKTEQRLSHIAQQLVTQGLVEGEIVDEVVKSDRTAGAKIKRLYQIASKPARASVYDGDGKSAKVHTPYKSRLDPSEKIETIEGRTLQQRNASALQKIAKLVKSNVITMDEVERLTQGARSPEEKVESVFSYLSKPSKKASYSQYNLTEHRMVKDRSKPLGTVPNREKRASALLWKEAHAKVDRLLGSGLLTQDKYETLKGISDPSVFVRKAFDLASQPTKVSEYQGEETAHMMNGNSSRRARSVSEVKVSTWLRQKMSEGSAGQELDVLLSSRFSQDVLRDHNSRVSSLREAHEGVSGHVYVDAEAYMTDNGTSGCEKGALVHRANQVPTVLKTARCGTCVFNSQGTCQKYAKPLIASVNDVLEDVESYRDENIRLANGTDADRTASLFVNEYDPSEFGLSSDGSFALNDAPSTEQLEGVLFGGFEV